MAFVSSACMDRRFARTAVRPFESCLRCRSGVALLRIVVIIALFALLIVPPYATAQSSRTKPAPAPAADLRSVYATAADVAEGRRISETTCTRCHGLNGLSGTKGVPHLAGQRPAYLHGKLRAYQAGTRGGHDMEPALKYLKDDALVKVAAYYGSLEPAQPTSADTRKALPNALDPVAAGKAGAAACAGCHGETGVTAVPGMPNLVGLDPKYFVAAMNAYKTGQRKHDVMQSVSASLGEADFKNLALYYALQKAARAATAAAGNPAVGKTAAAACTGCHGENGVSATPGTPSIAGQDAEYHIAALRAYRDGQRKDEAMKGLVAGLSEQQMKDLSAYYAAQEPRAPKVDKPLTLPEWVERCDRCHGVNGNSADPRTPALAGQRQEYLEKALKAYQSGVRKDSVMAAMSAMLNDTDVQALSAYYSRQRARAFVYVMVPRK